MATKLYVATETFLTNVDDVPTTVERNITYVTGDSEMYRRFPDKFREAEPHFSRGVEQATAAPGEERQVVLTADEEVVVEEPAKGPRK